MTTGRLAAKMRKLREEHEEAEMENGELNLVPYLDIVTNVIMFLMMTMTFSAALADINVSVPTTSVGGDSSDEHKPNRDLNLTVSISEKGLTIAASGGVLYENDQRGKLPTIPKVGADYNYSKLTELLRKIKLDPANAAQEETKVILNANPDITYEVVVATMDATRGSIVQRPDPANPGKMISQAELFPDVLLSAGVN